MAWDWGYQYNALVSFLDCVWEPDYLRVSIQWLTWAWPSVRMPDDSSALQIGKQLVSVLDHH